jgi:hypothetical protein
VANCKLARILATQRNFLRDAAVPCCCRYKYIYIRSPKSASTSVVNVLGECDNVRTRGYNSSSCMALHFYWPKSALQLESLQHMWNDYFVFGFVRNPWQRAYSLYKYLHSNGCMDE